MKRCDMERPYTFTNTAERKRLCDLVARLTDDQLKCATAEGWTVSALLAHLAFWDQRALALLYRWKHSGVGASPIDIDAVNDATLPLCLALPPRTAAELAISSATAIDDEIEHLTPELIADIEQLGGKFRFDRAEHRREHLDQIEALLRLNRDDVCHT